MLRRFAGRALLAAKTSVKEPVKAKTAAKKKEKKAEVVIDRSKFHHNDWLGTTVFDLAKALPQPELPAWDERDTWLHKNGQGLKFYRPLWTRYPEPCYWTVAKMKLKKKPSVKHSRVWGFLTWRGRTEPLPRPIPGSHRKEWRILLEPGTQLGPSLDNCWTAPEITLESDPKLSTQLPEDLPGVLPGTWPYPWGKQGTRNFPRDPPSTERSKEIAQKRADDAKEDKSEHEDALLREAFAHEASIEVETPPQDLDYYCNEQGERLEVDSKVEAGTKLFNERGQQMALVQTDEDGDLSIVAVDKEGKPVKYEPAAPESASAAQDALPGEFDEDLLEDVDEDEDAVEDEEDEDGLDDEDREWQLEDEENPSERGELDERRGVYQKKRDRRAIDDEEDEDEDDDEDDAELADMRLEKEMNREERARLMRRRLNRENGPRGGARFDEDGEEIDEDEDEDDFDEDEEGEEAEEDADDAEEETLVEDDLAVDADAETADLEAEAAEGEVLEGDVPEGEGEAGAAFQGKKVAPAAAAAAAPKGAAGKKKQ